MNIGKLNTYFAIFERQTSKDETGQRSTIYSQIGEVKGQHVIRNMTSNESGNRDNPVVSEYLYTYYEENIKPNVILVDDLGNQFQVHSLRRTNDRALIQSAVSLYTEAIIEV